MKTKNLCMLAIAALMFAACSNDDGPGGNDGNGPIDPNGEAWVALNVAKPTTTRAINPESENDNAIDNEADIETVRIIFFDADQRVTKDLSVATEDVTGAESPKAFKIPASSKYFLVVANANSTVFPSQVVGRSYENVNSAITATADDVANTTDGFMMTNAKGGLEPSYAVGNTDGKTPGELREMKLYATADAALLGAETVFIDRVVSKIRVYLTPGLASANTNATATVRSFEWLPNVTNKKFFPASKRTETAEKIALASDRYQLGTYRIDPNYDNNTPELMATNYNILSPSVTGWLPETDKDDKTTFAYCLENTQSADQNMHGYTTQVMIKAEFSPKGLTRPGTPSPSPATVDVVAGEDWVDILGVRFSTATPATGGTLREWLKDELTKKYLDMDADNFSAEYTQEFSNFLNLKGLGEIDLMSKADFIATYDVITGNDNGVVDADEADEGAKKILENQFDGKLALLLALTDPNDRAGEYPAGSATPAVKYYAGGVNYYNVIIKHDNNIDETDNLLGEFGVVRNSVYDITISAINNPGSPVIKEPNPETPDEEQDLYGAIKIEVNEWDWYTQDETL